MQRKLNSKELVDRFIISHNKQEDSPLFCVIPPELRNRIFHLACQSSPCKDKPYPRDSYYYRPGYEFPQKVYTDLLRTCRLVYLETRLLPVKINEHAFWCGRGPPGRYTGNPSGYFGEAHRFTEEQLDAVDTVHIFTQSWWLEGNFPSLCRDGGIRTRKIHITVRHSDWWWWEQNKPLHLKREWLESLKEIKGLDTFILELETIERDKDQMYTIANGLKTRKIELQNGGTLIASGSSMEQWRGPSKFERQWCYLKDRNVWSRRDPWLRAQGPDPGLVYCTVMLTWKVQ